MSIELETHYCSGALLNENWVITVASCEESSDSVVIKSVQFGGQANETKQTYVKESVLNKFNPMLSVSSQRFIRHPKYCSVMYYNDIALISNSFNLHLFYNN